MTPNYSTVSLVAPPSKGWRKKQPDNVTFFIAVTGSAALSWLPPNGSHPNNKTDTVIFLEKPVETVFK